MPLPALHGAIGVRRSVEVIASCVGCRSNRRLLTKAGGRYTFTNGLRDVSFTLSPDGSTVYHIACPTCGHWNEVKVPSMKEEKA